jgi:hypothetical protein
MKKLKKRKTDFYKITILFLILFNVSIFKIQAQFYEKPHNSLSKGKYIVGASFRYYDDKLDNIAPNWYREIGSNIRIGKYISNRWIIGASTWVIFAFPDNNKREIYNIIGGYADYNFLFLQAIPMYAEFGLHYSNYCYRDEGVFRDKSMFGQVGLGFNPRLGNKKRWGLDIGMHQYNSFQNNGCTIGLRFYRIGVNWIFPFKKEETSIE